MNAIRTGHQEKLKAETLKAEMGTAVNQNLAPVTPDALAVEPYINKKEVARRLGRTTRGVDKMMRGGLIPYYKFGYRVAYRWSEIQKHLAETCHVCRTLRSATGGKG